MKQTLIVMSRNRAMQDGTRACIQVLREAGAQYAEQTGSADVSLARNIALTLAFQTVVTLNAQLEKANVNVGQGPRNPIDTVLMVDDDMTFTLEQAAELVEHSRRTGVAASAMYATLLGGLAAVRAPTPTGAQQLWWTGLGLLAVPFDSLRRLAASSEIFPLHNGMQAAFTWSGVRDGRWFSEDFNLCRRLGGVHLLPLAVGHLKTVGLYPDDDTVGKIRAGELLPL